MHVYAGSDPHESLKNIIDKEEEWCLFHHDPCIKSAKKEMTASPFISNRFDRVFYDVSS